MFNILGVDSLVSVYAPTASEFSVKETFYAQLKMGGWLVSQGVVLGDFNATTSTEGIAVSQVFTGSMR